MIMSSPQNSFKQIFYNSCQAMLLIDPRLEFVCAVNNAAAVMLGYPLESLKQRAVSDIAHIPNEQKQGIYLNRLLEQNQCYKTELCFLPKNKDIICAFCAVRQVYDQGRHLLFYFFTIEKTSQCRQNKILAAKNLALKELLSQIEQERNQVKQNIGRHIEQEIMPLLGKVALSGKAEKYITLIRKHLTEINSSLRSVHQPQDYKLTPREAEISRLIRDGLTSKEIAQLLNITSQTIDKHRQNIRKKLGIHDQTINLSSYLAIP